MEQTLSGDQSKGPLAELAVLVTSHASLELRGELTKAGAHVIACPELKIGKPEIYTSLDEAIANLYGYDWLIFIKLHSVTYFLDRFRELGHEVSELDGLRVCALDDTTAKSLEESSVHLDLIPDQFDAGAVLAALTTYAGGADTLRGLTFLLPQASIGRDYLKEHLAEAGARADVVAAYGTVAASDSSLPRLRTLILNGGVDCILFEKAADVQDLSSLFDLNDLSRLLRDVAVVCLDNSSSQAAARLNARTIIKPAEPSFLGMVRAIACHFSR